MAQLNLHYPPVAVVVAYKCQIWFRGLVVPAHYLALKRDRNPSGKDTRCMTNYQPLVVGFIERTLRELFVPYVSGKNPGHLDSETAPVYGRSADGFGSFFEQPFALLLSSEKGVNGSLGLPGDKPQDTP